MDIRKYFVNMRKRKTPDGGSSDNEEGRKLTENTGEKIQKRDNEGTLASAPAALAPVGKADSPPKNICHPSSSAADGSSSNPTLAEECSEYDIGLFVGRISALSTERKKELLENCWTPHENYDFGRDQAIADLPRKFNFEWLKTYAPWLVYSKHKKGALCKYCTLFPPSMSSVRGVLGSFIIRPLFKFKDIHERCKKHEDSHFHKDAVEAARCFLDSVPVDVQASTYTQKQMEENKKIISSVISCITFCGSHDLALRGKKSNEGILEGLFKFRIDAGDTVLQKHFEHGMKNATYRSPDIQNEIINICGKVVRDDIIRKIKKASAYSILADETADISGKEQLSIGLRYFDEEAKNVQEEFVGFVELEAFDAETIAHSIDEFVGKLGLDSNKCVGLGFDGCSTMSGKERGVQAILRKKYTKAFFFHCSSHKLNLVINDLNDLSEIRNTVSTIKEIISFFRESPLRRKLIPNITKLCETRWSEKHKAVRVFQKNFVAIVEGLNILSYEGNGNTRVKAYQLHSAACRTPFIISMILISKYSAMLEPVVTVLQSISLDIVKASQHIKRITQLLKSHRDDPEKIASEILADATIIGEQLGLEESIRSLPRIAKSQKHRSNHPAGSPLEYWRRSLVIPYLDSIIASLELRFHEERTPALALAQLHPSQILTEPSGNLTAITGYWKELEQFYEFRNIKGEIELWQTMWREKEGLITHELSVLDVIKEADSFFPEIKRALEILIALPCTTCTVERSFSSLRRIKTWLRSTMGADRLDGLAMMSVHRRTIVSHLEEFTSKVVDIFTKNPRRLCFKR